MQQSAGQTTPHRFGLAGSLSWSSTHVAKPTTAPPPIPIARESLDPASCTRNRSTSSSSFSCSFRCLRLRLRFLSSRLLTLCQGGRPGAIADGQITFLSCDPNLPVHVCHVKLCPNTFRGYHGNLARASRHPFRSRYRYASVLQFDRVPFKLNQGVGKDH